MSAPNHATVERVLAKLSDERTLGRFLEHPRAVFQELAGGHADDATLEAVGRQLRDRLAARGDLSEQQLEAIAGGRLNFGSLSPTLGRTYVGPSTITMTY
jgi:hypothetical protein